MAWLLSTLCKEGTGGSLGKFRRLRWANLAGPSFLRILPTTGPACKSPEDWELRISAAAEALEQSLQLKTTAALKCV